MSVRIVQALTVAFQYVNQAMPDIAIEEMAQDLAAHPEQDVLAALKRCRSELKAIRYGDILDRLPGGHPGPEEAWSIVHRSMQSEAVTVVWTDQMREAYGVAVALGDDSVAARVAFREAYIKLVSEARSKNIKPIWSVSLGRDKADQERQITEAMKAGKILPDYGRSLLPYSDAVTHAALAIMPKMKELA